MALVGIGASYLIIPADAEVALMHYKDKHYTKALSLYENLYIQGDDDIDVIIPLSNLYYKFGNVTKSVALMKHYIKKNPDSIDGLYHLGELYKSSQRFADYLETLKRISKLSANGKIFKELADLYQTEQDSTSQAEVLEKLINSDEYLFNEKDYKKLMIHYASNGEYKKSLFILTRMIKNSNFKIDIQSMALILHIAIDAKENDRAFELANKFIEQEKNKEKIIKEVIGIVNNKRSFKLSLEILEKNKTHFINQSLYEELFIMLKLNLGQEIDVYKKLIVLLNENRLSLVLTEQLIELANKFKDDKLMEQIVQKVNLNEISKQSIFYFLKISITMNKPKIAQKILDKAKTNLFLRDPFLYKFAKYASESKPLQSFIKDLFDNKIRIRPSYKKNLISLCFDNGLRESGFKILDSMPIFQSISILEIPVFIEALVEYGDIKKYKKILIKYKKDLYLEKVLFLLSAATGETKIFNNILIAKGESFDETILTDAFFIAEQYAQYKLSLKVTKLLIKRSPTAINRLYLCDSLISNEEYDKAIKEIIYIQENFKSYKAEVDLKLLMTFSKIVNKKGYNKIIMFKDIYNPLIERLMARNDLSDQKNRELGYLLSSIKEYSKATTVFLNLTKNILLVTDDVRQLIYLYQITENENILTFLINRANSAKEKEEWLYSLAKINKNSNQLHLKLIEIIKEISTEKYLGIYLYLIQKQNAFPAEIAKYKNADFAKYSLMQRELLLTTFLKEKLYENAFAMEQSFTEKEMMEFATPLEISEIYVRNNQIDLGLKKYKEPRIKSLFYAAKGIDVMLASRGSIEQDEILDCILIAKFAKQIKLAIRFAEIYDDKNILAELYIIDKQPLQALKTLEKSKVNRQLFLDAITLAISMKKEKEVKPYIAKLIEFAKIANKKDNLSIGYILLDLKLFKEAEPMFLEAAQNKKYYSSEVQSLLYIWGNILNQKQLNWVVLKLNKESNYIEQSYWLKYLLNVNEAKRCESFLSKFEKIPLDFIDIYFAVLSQLNKQNLLKLAINEFDLQKESLLRDEQKILLIQIYYKNFFQERALQLANKMKMEVLFEKLNEFEFAEIYLLLKEKYELAKSFIDNKDDSKAKNIETIFKVAKSAETADINVTGLTEIFMSDLFYFSIKNNKKRISLTLAKEIYKLNKSKQIILAEAYILNEKYIETINLLEEHINKIVQSDIRVTNFYLKAISELYKKEGESVLDKYNSQIDTIVKNISKTNLTDSQKRGIGYILSDLNRIDAAKQIFFKLAKEVTISSPDVEQLIYLIGNKTTKKELQWIVKKIEIAESANKIKWYKILNQTGNSDTVLLLLETQ